MKLLPCIRAFFVLLAFSSAVPSIAQVNAVKLSPIDDWQVVQSDGLCTIIRTFGKSSAPTTIQLRNRDPWNGGFHVAISSDRFELNQGAFRAGWLPNGKFITIHRPTYEFEDEGKATVVFRHGLWDGQMPKSGSEASRAYWSVDDEDEIVGPANFKRAIEGFLVDGAFERSLLFATGPMFSVIDARDECIKKVLVAKGIDPMLEDRDDHIVALKNSRSLASRIFRRTPQRLRYSGNWGGVTFLVYVDSKAEVTACNLSSLPYDAEFEAYGCGELTKKADFQFKKGERPQAAFFKLHASID